MILLTIDRNTSTIVSLFAGIQVLSIISVRSVSNTCSIGRIGGKKALKSKGLLALFGPVNPGGENRGPKNIWKSRYLTMLRGPRPTRQNRELKSADRNHIVTIFFDRSGPFIVIARWMCRLVLRIGEHFSMCGTSRVAGSAPQLKPFLKFDCEPVCNSQIKKSVWARVRYPFCPSGDFFPQFVFPPLSC